MGLPLRLASASASSPHGYQSTGFSACCCRYGLVSFASRFGILRTLPQPRRAWADARSGIVARHHGNAQEAQDQRAAEEDDRAAGEAPRSDGLAEEDDA